MRRSTKFKGGLLILILGSVLCSPSISMAVSLLGGSIIVQNTGDVFATYQGSSAAYSSTLFLQNTGQSLFNNKTSSIGTTINLGSFQAGTELVFGLTVHDTGYTFYTGGGSLNPDGIAHAFINETFGQQDEALVSFEDLFGGGDKDYNDHQFSFKNVAGAIEQITDTNEGGLPTDTNGDTIANPEPSTVILLGTGLMGLTAWRWRKQKS